MPSTLRIWLALVVAFALCAWVGSAVSPNAPGNSLATFACTPGLLLLLALAGGNAHGDLPFTPVEVRAIVVATSALTYASLALGVWRLRSRRATHNAQSS